MQVEFKLFGSLTVKQFVSLSGGIVIAAIIYFIGLPAILGWPLIALSVIIGFAMTFVTVNGQPFSRWFGNFLSAMFSSQKYVWRKGAQTPRALKGGAKKTQTSDKVSRKKELGVTPIIEVVKTRNIQLNEEEEKDLSRLDKYFEAEFDKYETPAPKSRQKRTRKSQRVDMRKGNLAGNVNPVGRNQRQVKVGQNERVVFEDMKNQTTRPMSQNKIDKQIEDKVKEILRKQKKLDPYLKTKDVEKVEREMKKEMKQIYQEIQQLKAT